MKRYALPLLLLGSLALGGCAASIAASVVGAAVRSAKKPEDPNADPGPDALKTCQAHAAQHGTVQIIDVERRSGSRAIVWGTVQNQGERRSFECRYDGKIVDFKLRAIPQRP
jgi:hypothetical protein